MAAEPDVAVAAAVAAAPAAAAALAAPAAVAAALVPTSPVAATLVAVLKAAVERADATAHAAAPGRQVRQLNLFTLYKFTIEYHVVY